MSNETLAELKPCPFCGAEVVAIIGGSHVYIGCCAEMSLQKSDVLTIEERKTWGQKPFRYSEEAEKKALQHATSMWNTRPGEDKLRASGIAALRRAEEAEKERDELLLRVPALEYKARFYDTMEELGGNVEEVALCERIKTVYNIENAKEFAA